MNRSGMFLKTWNVIPINKLFLSSSNYGKKLLKVFYSLFQRASIESVIEYLSLKITCQPRNYLLGKDFKSIKKVIFLKKQKIKQVSQQTNESVFLSENSFQIFQTNGDQNLFLSFYSFFFPCKKMNTILNICY